MPTVAQRRASAAASSQLASKTSALSAKSTLPATPNSKSDNSVALLNLKCPSVLTNVNRRAELGQGIPKVRKYAVCSPLVSLSISPDQLYSYNRCSRIRAVKRTMLVLLLTSYKSQFSSHILVACNLPCPPLSLLIRDGPCQFCRKIVALKLCQPLGAHIWRSVLVLKYLPRHIYL